MSEPTTFHPSRKNARWQSILYATAALSITYLLGQFVFAWRVSAWGIPIMRKAAIFLRNRWLFVLMWLPGLIALLFRLLFKQGFQDVGWHPGKLRFWGWAILGPLVVFSLVFLLADLFGIIQFSLDTAQHPLWEGYFQWAKLSWPSWTPDSKTLQFMLRFSAISTVVLAEAFILALGEELGWRGYLQTRLMRSGWPAPLSLCGFIWAMWHFPFLRIVWGGGTLDSVLNALFFTTTITLMGVFIGWLRLASDSVWIAAAMHAAHNAYIGLYSMTYSMDHALLIVSESGVFTMAAYGALVFWLYRSGRISELMQAFHLPLSTKRQPF